MVFTLHASMRLILLLPLLASVSPPSSGLTISRTKQMKQFCDKICDCSNPCGCSCSRPGPLGPGGFPGGRPHFQTHTHSRPKPTKKTTKATKPPTTKKTTKKTTTTTPKPSSIGSGGGHGHTGVHPGGYGIGGTNRMCMEPAQLPDTAWNNLCRRKKPKRPHYRRFTFSGGQCISIGWDDCKTPASNNFPSMAKCTNICRTGGGGISYVYRAHPVGRGIRGPNPMCFQSVRMPDTAWNKQCRKNKPKRQHYQRFTFSGGRCKAVRWDACKTSGPNNFATMEQCNNFCSS